MISFFEERFLPLFLRPILHADFRYGMAPAAVANDDRKSGPNLILFPGLEDWDEHRDHQDQTLEPAEKEVHFLIPNHSLSRWICPALSESNGF